MIALPGIKVRDCWGCVDFVGDAVVEFLDLFSNVAQKGVAGPAINHHDEKHKTSTKEHCHCHARADGVCANLVSGNVEGDLSNCQDGILQRVLDLP
jgi:hypothetical protein